VIIPFKVVSSTINPTPDKPEYIRKITTEIIQATNLKSEDKKAKFFITISNKRLKEAVIMLKEARYAYIGELVKAYRELLNLSIVIYGRLNKEGKRKILDLLNRCLPNNIVDLVYLLRNSPRSYKSEIQKSLNYTLERRKQVEKILEKSKKKW
jgi:hypothetical protein